VPNASAATIDMLDRMIPAPSAWRRDDLKTEDYLVTLSPACLDEILRAVAAIGTHPLPTILLDPAEFELTHCRAAMATVRHMLDHGVRFALVDRLPMDQLSVEQAKAVYWLLSNLVSRPVAQSIDGTMIYDVLDTGRISTPGSGIRPDKTSIEIRFHNDNSYNRATPDYVGLLCVRPAQRGGHSRVMSFLTAHNHMLERHRDLLPRLYQPFWFDRQREFLPGETPIFSAPVFEYDGALRARFSAHQINSGYILKGEPVDDTGGAAIKAMLGLFHDDGLSIDFDLEAGQLQFVHNRAVGHSRTAFEDHAEPDHRRHLVRLWLRDHGKRGYPG